jgi:hypothetical protein
MQLLTSGLTLGCSCKDERVAEPVLHVIVEAELVDRPLDRLLTLSPSSL